jgi:REP element-mobilizing transposase RayT
MRDRTNPRHPTFDYRSHAAYFVTLCTHDRRCLFGTVRRGRTVLNACGRIAAREWTRSEAMRDEIVLDAFVVMPNHLHGIICIVPPDVDDVSPRGYDLDVGAASMPTKRIPNDDVETTGRSSLHNGDNPRRKKTNRMARLPNPWGR